MLESELPEQVLDDGGHIERSPMYQLRVAWLLLTLRNADADALAPLVDGPLARLLRAVAAAASPGRRDRAVQRQRLRRLSGAAGAARGPRARHGTAGVRAGAGRPRGFALARTGYFGAPGRDGAYVVCDAGPIGPDYQPGHAHGDLLSFELSFAGRRVVTDSGVHGYEDDPLRAWCRSTHAHNTVEIDGQSQCEFWSVFRVARRARPARRALRGAGRRLSPRGLARRLPAARRAARATQRRFAWHERGVLLVKDEITSARSVTARSRLHLHPDCVVEELAGPAARIRHPGGVFQVRFAGPGELALEASSYCPEFGVRQRAHGAALRGVGRAPRVRLLHRQYGGGDRVRSRPLGPTSPARRFRGEAR